MIAALLSIGISESLVPLPSVVKPVLRILLNSPRHSTVPTANEMLGHMIGCDAANCMRSASDPDSGLNSRGETISPITTTNGKTAACQGGGWHRYCLESRRVVQAQSLLQPLCHQTLMFEVPRPKPIITAAARRLSSGAAVKLVPRAEAEIAL